MAFFRYLNPYYAFYLAAITFVPSVCQSEIVCPGDTQAWRVNDEYNKFEYCYSPSKELAEVRHGPFVSYYDNESVKATGEYENGKKKGYWNYYSALGQLLARGQYRDGVANGGWEYFHENGRRSGAGSYSKNREQGVWTYWDREGVKRIEATYQDGIRSGLYREWDDNGSLFSEGANGDFSPNGWKRQGKWQSYYSNGAIRSAGYYDQGKRTGEWKFYFENGGLSASGKFSLGRQTEHWRFWSVSGKLLEEGSYEITDRPALGGSWRAGFWVFYFEDGEKQRQGNFQDGKPVGTWTFWDANGNTLPVTFQSGEFQRLERSPSFVAVELKCPEGTRMRGNGPPFASAAWCESSSPFSFLGFKKTHGTRMTWYDDGHLWSISHYDRDKLQGSFYNSLNSGLARIEKSYRDNRQHGEYSEYNAFGQLEKSGNFTDGEKTGRWRMWDDSGNLLGFSEHTSDEPNGEYTRYYDSIFWFKEGYNKNARDHGVATSWERGIRTASIPWEDGRQSGATSYYHSHGILSQQGAMHDIKKDGLWQWFDENGQLYQQDSFKQDRQDGRRSEWYLNGNKKYDMYHQNGVRSGTFEKYLPNGEPSIKGHYENNQRSGTWIEWFENGDREETDYQHDRKNGIFIRYRADGTKTFEMNYKEDMPHGAHIRYHFNGGKAEECYYNEGVLLGDCKRWTENGVLLNDDAANIPSVQIP